jgi:hypothetical protein
LTMSVCHSLHQPPPQRYTPPLLDYSKGQHPYQTEFGSLSFFS